MSKVIETSNARSLSQVSEPGFGQGSLTEVLRKGARDLLAQAVEQVVHEWLTERVNVTDERGSQRAFSGVDDPHGDWSGRSLSAACA